MSSKAIDRLGPLYEATPGRAYAQFRDLTTGGDVSVRSQPGRVAVMFYDRSGALTERQTFTSKGWSKTLYDPQTQERTAYSFGAEEGAMENVWDEIPETKSP